MALVREFTASNGAHIQIYDDCYAGISEEELQQRYRQISETILRIDRNIQLREMKAKEEAERAAKKAKA